MPVGDTIFLRLEAATDEEIAELCKILKIAGTIDRGVDKTNLSRALRAAGGNTLRNIFRGEHDLPYKQILIDVADKLHPGFGWTEHILDDDSTEEDLEDEITKAILERWQNDLEGLSQEEREKKAKELDEELKNLGYSTGLRAALGGAITGATVGTLGANSAVIALFYSGTLAGLWASVFGPSTFLLIASGTGISLLAGIPFLIGLLSTPAYRKTIPAVLQLIGIRHRRIAESQLEED